MNDYEREQYAKLIDFDNQEVKRVMQLDKEIHYIKSRIEQYIRDTPKIGRNELCSCGSGKKYKKCCLIK